MIADFVEQDLGRFCFTLGLYERFAAMAAAQDWDHAEHHFQHALQVVDDEIPHRIDQARVRYWYAHMLLERDAPGDRDRARELLAKARSLSEEMGMHGLIRRIDKIHGEERR